MPDTEQDVAAPQQRNSFDELDDVMPELADIRSSPQFFALQHGSDLGRTFGGRNFVNMTVREDQPIDSGRIYEQNARNFDRDFKRQFPNQNPELYRDLHRQAFTESHRQSLLSTARAQVQQSDVTPAGDTPAVRRAYNFATTYAPFLGTAWGAVAAGERDAAVSRINNGAASPRDYLLVAQQEKDKDTESRATLLSQLGNSIQHLPAMALEFGISGGALRAAGIGARAGQGLVSTSTGRALLGGLRGTVTASDVAATIGTRAAQTAAQTFATPSMWVPEWTAGNEAAGRRPFSLQGLPAAAAMGYLNTAVLGSIGDSFPLATGRSLGAYTTRAAQRLLYGMAEQGVADVIGTAVNAETGWGLGGAVIRGLRGDQDWSEAARQAVLQAVTFSAFGALHEVQHGAPEARPEAKPEKIGAKPTTNLEVPEVMKVLRESNESADGAGWSTDRQVDAVGRINRSYKELMDHGAGRDDVERIMGRTGETDIEGQYGWGHYHRYIDALVHATPEVPVAPAAAQQAPAPAQGQQGPPQAPQGQQPPPQAQAPQNVQQPTQQSPPQQQQAPQQQAPQQQPARVPPTPGGPRPEGAGPDALALERPEPAARKMIRSLGFSDKALESIRNSVERMGSEHAVASVDWGTRAQRDYALSTARELFGNKPPASPVPPTTPHQEFLDKHLAGLQADPNISPENKAKFGSALQRVVGSLPVDIAAKLHDNVTSVRFFDSGEAMGEERAKVSSKYKGGKLGGLYIMRKNGVNELWLDGDMNTKNVQLQTHETYAHELAHAIDGPQFEYSSSKEWEKAWREEIKNGPLTHIAAKNPREGFAEMMRLLHGANQIQMAEVLRLFPESVRFLQENGLLPTQRPEAPPVERQLGQTGILPEIFGDVHEDKDGIVHMAPEAPKETPEPTPALPAAMPAESREKAMMREERARDDRIASEERVKKAAVDDLLDEQFRKGNLDERERYILEQRRTRSLRDIAKDDMAKGMRSSITYEGVRKVEIKARVKLEKLTGAKIPSLEDIVRQTAKIGGKEGAPTPEATGEEQQGGRPGIEFMRQEARERAQQAGGNVFLYAADNPETHGLPAAMTLSDTVAKAEAEGAKVSDAVRDAHPELYDQYSASEVNELVSSFKRYNREAIREAQKTGQDPDTIRRAWVSTATTRSGGGGQTAAAPGPREAEARAGQEIGARLDQISQTQGISHSAAMEQVAKEQNSEEQNLRSQVSELESSQPAPVRPAAGGVVPPEAANPGAANAAEGANPRTAQGNAGAAEGGAASGGGAPERVLSYAERSKKEMEDFRKEIQEGVQLTKEREQRKNPTVELPISDEDRKSTTALANVMRDRDRRAQGLPTLFQEPRRAHKVVWDAAMRMLDKDPDAGKNLVDRLLRKTGPVSAEEGAILAHRLLTLKDQHRVAMDEYNKATEQGADALTIAPLEAKETQLYKDYNDTDQVSKSSGSEAGRSLNFRRVLIQEDYGPIGLISAMQAAKGSPLSVQERAKFAKMSQEIQDLQKLERQAAAALDASGTGHKGPEFQAWVDARTEMMKKMQEADAIKDSMRLARGTLRERMDDLLTRIRRSFVISSPTTMVKIVAAALQRFAITPAQEAVGSAWSQLPGIAKIAAMAPREGGGFRPAIESQAFFDGVTKGFQDAWQSLPVVGQGRSNMEVMLGGKDAVPRGFLDWVGMLHNAAKAPAVRNELTRSFLQRIEHGAKNGQDVLTSDALFSYMTDAYKDALAAKFQGQSKVVDAWNNAIRTLQSRESSNAAYGIGTGMKLAVPVVRVPTNLVAEAFEYAFGAVTGGYKAARALREGVEKLQPNEADAIMRQLKKGSLGAAGLLLAYLSPHLVGGFYSGKRRSDEPEAGSLAGVPSYLLHNPLLEVLQMGATVRRAQDAVRRGQRQDLTEGMLAGTLGLVEEVPFVRSPIELGRAFKAETRGKFMGELAKSLAVPQLMNWLAGRLDVDSEGKPRTRDPRTFLQTIGTGIPGVRNQMPQRR